MSVCDAAMVVAKKGQMKLIIAYIQPERLNAVKQALFAREIYKMSVTNALGCGQQPTFFPSARSRGLTA